MRQRIQPRGQRGAGRQALHELRVNDGGLGPGPVLVQRVLAASGLVPDHPLAAVLDWYGLNAGRDNFDFEGSEDQRHFAAWRGNAPPGAGGQTGATAGEGAAP